MEGAALAAERQHEREVRLAWRTAAFVGSAWAGKLKDISEYLPKSAPPKEQTPEELLQAFVEMQEAGAPISIRQIN